MQFEDNPLRRLQLSSNFFPRHFSLFPFCLICNSDLSLARTAGPWGESWPVMLPGAGYFGRPYSKAAETPGF